MSTLSRCSKWWRKCARLANFFMMAQNLTIQPPWYMKDSHLRYVRMKIPLHSGVAALMVGNPVFWDSLHDPGRLGAERVLSLELLLCLGWDGFSCLSSDLAQQEESTMGALAGSSGLLRQQLRGTAADGAISPLKLCFKLWRGLVNNEKLQLTLCLLLSQ